MLGRYEENTVGKPLPNEWQEDFVAVINEAYHAKAEAAGRFFDVYGAIYDREFVVISSYIHKEDQLAAPITLFISHDIITDEKKMKKALKDVVNLAGLIWDDILATDEWNDFVPNWTENDFNGNQFHYKITRENISLTLQANEILAGKLADEEL